MWSLQNNTKKKNELELKNKCLAKIRNITLNVLESCKRL